MEGKDDRDTWNRGCANSLAGRWSRTTYYVWWGAIQIKCLFSSVAYSIVTGRLHTFLGTAVVRA
jgi:hypothetical protein